MPLFKLIQNTCFLYFTFLKCYVSRDLKKVEFMFTFKSNMRYSFRLFNSIIIPLLQFINLFAGNSNYCQHNIIQIY